LYFQNFEIRDVFHVDDQPDGGDDLMQPERTCRSGVDVKQSIFLVVDDFQDMRVAGDE